MTEISVASFNLHWGRGLRWLGFKPFDVLAACARLDTDVLVLQESWAPDGGEAQHDTVARELGYATAVVSLARAVIQPHPAVVDRADPTRQKGTGDWCLAILSRLPIAGSEARALPQLRLDPTSRHVLQAELTVGDGALVVHGTHLPHLEFGAPLITKALRAALGPADRPAILIGDMNMWGWCISAMAPPGWRRVGRGRTFPTPYAHSRIDHLLVTPGVEVLSTEVVAERGSDHRPIRARLAVT
jgi:endonuclease/exonuclease/phosphatase family metal-dependent hydrolase